jgi:hypothetical protein
VVGGSVHPDGFWCERIEVYKWLDLIIWKKNQPVSMLMARSSGLYPGISKLAQSLFGIIF